MVLLHAVLKGPLQVIPPSDPMWDLLQFGGCTKIEHIFQMLVKHGDLPLVESIKSHHQNNSKMMWDSRCWKKTCPLNRALLVFLNKAGLFLVRHPWIHDKSLVVLVPKYVRLVNQPSSHLCYNFWTLMEPFVESGLNGEVSQYCVLPTLLILMPPFEIMTLLYFYKAFSSSWTGWILSEILLVIPYTFLKNYSLFRFQASLEGHSVS